MSSSTSRITAANGAVAIEPIGRTIRATLGGRTVVETDDGVRLLEHGHPPVYYLPLRDVADGVLRPSSTHTVCPRKGQADYFDLVVGDTVLPDAAWTYPEAAEGALDLAPYLAFYWDRLDRWYEDGRAIDAPTPD